MESAFDFSTRRFTPFAFRPRVEQVFVAMLGVAASVLWLVLLPAELALRLG